MTILESYCQAIQSDALEIMREIWLYAKSHGGAIRGQLGYKNDPPHFLVRRALCKAAGIDYSDLVIKCNTQIIAAETTCYSFEEVIAWLDATMVLLQNDDTCNELLEIPKREAK